MAKSMEYAKKFKSNVDKIANPKVQGVLQAYVHAPMILIAIVVITLQAISFNYIQKLEQVGCECAKDWKRDFIFWYLVVSIIYWVFMIVVMSFGDKWNLMTSTPLYVFKILFNLGTIAFVVITLMYVSYLKKEKCKCSESAGRLVLQIMPWYYVATWALTLLAVLLFIMFGYDLMQAIKH